MHPAQQYTLCCAVRACVQYPHRSTRRGTSHHVASGRGQAQAQGKGRGKGKGSGSTNTTRSGCVVLFCLFPILLSSQAGTPLSLSLVVVLHACCPLSAITPIHAKSTRVCSQPPLKNEHDRDLNTHRAVQPQPAAITNDCACVQKEAEAQREKIVSRCSRRSSDSGRGDDGSVARQRQTGKQRVPAWACRHPLRQRRAVARKPTHAPCADRRR